MSKLDQLYSRIIAAAEISVIPSGILHLSALDPVGILALDGENTEATLDQAEWIQFYFELYSGALRPDSMPAPEEIQSRAMASEKAGLVPIFISHYRFHSAGRYLLNLLGGKSVEELTVPEQVDLIDATEERTCFFAAAYLPTRYHEYTQLPHLYHGRTVRFIVSPDNYLTNKGLREPKITIDFDDGNGPRNIDLGQAVQVNYLETGVKRIKLRAESDGATLQSSCTFEIREAVTMPPVDMTWTDLEFPIDDVPVTAKGHAWVFYGKGHTSLVSPIIVSEGFPGNYPLSYLWELFNAEGFATLLLASGRDLIILGYEDGKILIEANAGVVIACIKKVIESQSAAGAKLIVGGASMGGLVTRYALAYLERKGFPEFQKVDTYFSFDSPHLGANLPAGAILFINYLVSAKLLPNLKAKEAQTLFNSDASQELLANWIDPKNTLWQPSPKRKTFISTLGAFPNLPRKVGVANGAGNGAGNATPPNSLVINYSGIWGCKIWAADGEEIGQNRYLYFRDTTFKENSVLDKRLGQIDSAPGGTSDFFGFLAKGLGTTALYNDGTFIPTISALAVDGLSLYKQEDLYTDLSKGIKDTPFTAVKFSASNTPHVAITPEILFWLLTEFNIPYVNPVGQVSAGFQETRTPVTEVFSIVTDGTLYYRDYDGDWGNWVRNFNNAPTLRRVIPPSVWKYGDVFAIGPDFTTYRCFWELQKKAWSPWIPNFNGSDKLADLFVMDVDLFGIGQDYTLYHAYRSGGGFTPWNPAFPYTGLPQKMRKVFGYTNSMNQNKELWGVGAYNNVLYHCSWNSQSRRWDSWQYNWNDSRNLRFVDVFGTINGWNNVPELFVIDVRDVLYHTWWNGYEWHYWTYSLNGKDPYKALQSGFCICNKQYNPNVELFGIYNGELFYNYFNGEWQSWKPFNPVPGITSITGIYDESKILFLFAVGEENALFKCQSTGLKEKALTWSDWEVWPVVNTEKQLR